MICIVIPGAFLEARWGRPEPRRTVAAHVLQRIVSAAFPRRRVVEMQPLAEGMRNANFKLHLDSTPEPIVLRIYEHDASLCRKEMDLLRMVRGSVPVPEVLYAEPRGWEDLPPFILLRYTEGITFLHLKRTGDREAIAQAACSAGETLAAIGRFAFPHAGWLAPGPAVTAPSLQSEDPMPHLVDRCLASRNLQSRMPADLRDRISALMWAWAPQLACLDGQARLVHGDFNRRNLLVRHIAGKWSVAAVLDWEFAVSSSPLGDLDSFLRYESASRPLAEPHFSAGYLQAGGRLPDDWRRLARLLGVAALCESLTHDPLSDTVVTELVELVTAIIDALETSVN